MRVAGVVAQGAEVAGRLLPEVRVTDAEQQRQRPVGRGRLALPPPGVRGLQGEHGRHPRPAVIRNRLEGRGRRTEVAVEQVPGVASRLPLFRVGLRNAAERGPSAVEVVDPHPGEPEQPRVARRLDRVTLGDEPLVQAARGQQITLALEQPEQRAHRLKTKPPVAGLHRGVSAARASASSRSRVPRARACTRARMPIIARTLPSAPRPQPLPYAHRLPRSHPHLRRSPDPR